MKSIKYIFPLMLLVLGCKSNYLLTKKIELDSKTDQYVSEKLLTKEVGNYEVSASITFNESYRNKKTGWAGFFLKTTLDNGLYGKDSGYLFFIRENGEIGISSHYYKLPNKEIESSKRLLSLEQGKKIVVKIISIDNELTIYVNGEEHFNIPDLKLKGNYISANCGGTDVSIKIKSFKDIDNRM
jgi:hypothetical protein